MRAQEQGQKGDEEREEEEAMLRHVWALVSAVTMAVQISSASSLSLLLKPNTGHGKYTKKGQSKVVHVTSQG